MKKILKTASLPFRLAIRSQQVGFVFTSYGLGGTLSALGIEVGRRGMRWVGGKRQNIPFDGVMGKNLAQTFAKLGPTFIKLGQVLASRPDLIGEPAAEELKVLFDRVPTIPYREIQAILKRELGRQTVKTSFRSIDPQPLASASLSQTHRAVLADGTPVILKVQKTGVGDTVRLDLMLLEAFIRPLNLIYPRFQLLQIFQDFRLATLREIDYREEAKNIDGFHRNYARLFSDSDVVFPRYFAELTTERVIALEPIHGRKVSDLKKGSTVARKAAALGLAAILEQIFDHGYFHADPHAGNLFFMEDEGRLGFIDLGLVGRLEQADKRKFLKVLLAILQRDRTKLAQTLFELGEPSKKTEFATFEREINALLDDLASTGMADLRLDQVINRLLAVARSNGIVIPNRYIMMIRSCLLIEGVAKSLDPNISVFKVATPIVAKSLMRSYNPIRYLRRFF